MEDRNLFRGKEIAGKQADEWVYGYFVGANEPVDHHNEIYTPCEWGYERHVVWPESIGRCTALKDKNKRLIFEGDIVCATYGKEMGKMDIPTLNRICTVVWDGKFSSFGLAVSDSKVIIHIWDVRCNKDVEIIGNIHNK